MSDKNDKITWQQRNESQFVTHDNVSKFNYESV